MVRVPAPIVMIRISRLVDVGADLEGALAVDRVRSFEAVLSENCVDECVT